VKTCVRVYIEGGATGSTADSDFRKGWKTFLGELVKLARTNGYHSLEVVRGKGRAATFRRFTNYQNEHPNDLCVLLVDSETSVPEGSRVWDVVANREGDRWQRPIWATERHLYLMVPFVETWLLTDQEALRKFFKRNFNPANLPTTDLENRSKDFIEQKLKSATEHCPRGAYQHGQAHSIIENVQQERVKTLRHGKRLFDTLSSLIKNEPENRGS
jgi:Domain of unknown function (DUF4276)